MTARRIFVLTVIALIVASMTAGQGLALPKTGSVPAVDTSSPAPQDTPTTLVGWGVTRYDLAAPKLFWHTQPPPCPPPGALQQDYIEEISRIATYGSMTRTLYSEDVGCDHDVRSDLVADDDYVYWVDRTRGVVRLSVEANIGDQPEVLSDVVTGYAYLAQDDDYLFVVPMGGGSIYRIRKTDGSSFVRVTDPGTSPRNLQADGKYVYWVTGGELKRIAREGVPAFIVTIASGVSGYYPEGRKLSYCIIDPPQCFYTEYVFIGQGRDVVRYNNLTGDTTPLYTSPDSTARVYSLASYTTGLFGVSQLFFLESREVYCDPNPPGFCTYHDVLVRTDRAPGGTPEELYVTGTGLPTVMYIAEHLETDGTHLFWNELGALKRLPNDAEALPKINIEAWDMEITQGIQDPDNGTRLIEDRRTFVRVRADTVSEPVAGVSAFLYRTDSGGQIVEGPLAPVNPVGKQITVQPSPSRANLNESFLFELPWDWTVGTIYLRAEVNPFKYPLEPGYEDNVVTDGPFAFEASPRLPVQFVMFGYEWAGTTYYPRLIDDLFQTYSWVRRVYPLASTPGGYGDPTPGFRPNFWYVFDAGLGAKVYVDPGCTSDMFEDPKTYPQCSNLRASAHTNAAMKAMRVEEGVPADVFMYGLISDGLDFPRGQAWGGLVSSGPAGGGSWGWDYDGSYADWYAGHEIGHTLGRGHPAKGADDPATKDVREGCGHSADDSGYPYAEAKIGYSSLPNYGFDVGDPGLNPALQITVYPWTGWYDVMSYCPNQWISDYTYDAMYDFMMAHNAQYAAASPGPRLQGDLLSVFGEIIPSLDTATIYHLRHLDSVAEMPDLVPGDYSIRLLDSGGSTLGDYPFTPEEIDNVDPPKVSFGQVVSYTAGTVEVQIVRISDSLVLTSQTLSANPPAVSDVALQGAPDPVTGTVTLGWTASDPDGDDLAFNILYSLDGGVNFQPLQVGVSGSSAAVDTLPLAGSDSALLRVVASDGAHSAYDDSDPFTMEDKPPQVRILAPADGTQIHYGQLLNLMGEAVDLQDDAIADGNIVWSNQHGQLGTGPLLSVDDLPVGTNQVTFEATNSLGLSASAQITVIVDDDLDWPGPTLSVAPTQVGWHVEAGSTEIQTADLSASNAGTGDLDWVASEDADWLTIGALSGTVPFTLTLTADPAGMAPGTALTTTLWITSPASTDHTTQTVAIPVSLHMGDVWREAPWIPSHWIYLPLVVRGFTP